MNTFSDLFLLFVVLDFLLHVLLDQLLVLCHFKNNLNFDIWTIITILIAYILIRAQNQWSSRWGLTKVKVSSYFPFNFFSEYYFTKESASSLSGRTTVTSIRAGFWVSRTDLSSFLRTALMLIFFLSPKIF